MSTRKPDMDVAAGQAILNSKYVRAFCRSCGAAMRVSKKVFKSRGYPNCADCTRPYHPGHGTRSATYEYDGVWDNVVRVLEEAA